MIVTHLYNDQVDWSNPHVPADCTGSEIYFVDLLLERNGFAPANRFQSNMENNSFTIWTKISAEQKRSM